MYKEPKSKGKRITNKNRVGFPGSGIICCGTGSRQNEKKTAKIVKILLCVVAIVQKIQWNVPFK